MRRWGLQWKRELGDLSEALEKLWQLDADLASWLRTISSPCFARLACTLQLASNPHALAAATEDRPVPDILRPMQREAALRARRGDQLEPHCVLVSRFQLGARAPLRLQRPHGGSQAAGPTTATMQQWQHQLMHRRGRLSQRKGTCHISFSASGGCGRQRSGGQPVREHRRRERRPWKQTHGL